MYVSPTDPLNSVHDWFQARTYHAPRQQDWTPEADLFLDYHRHAEAAGIRPSKRLGAKAFAAELHGLTRRQPQSRLARPINGGPERHLPFWPRTLRAARQLAA